MRLFTGLLFTLSTFSLLAQVSNSLGVWVDHLPYRRGVDLEMEGGNVYLATTQALFIFNLEERTIDRVSKVNGLSDVGLTDIAWCEALRTLVIGYDNGNIDVYRDGEVDNFPDIRLSSNYSGLKRINHILVDGTDAYISTNFGIVRLDLERLLARETYIIGPEGAIEAVAQVALSADSMYAATEAGLYKADRNSALFFFDNWSVDERIDQSIDMVTVFGERLFVNVNFGLDSDTILYRESGQWQRFTQNEIARNLDLRSSRGYLCVVNSFSARAYTDDLSLFKNFNPTTAEDSTFTPSAAVMGESDQNFWVADLENALFQFFDLFAIPVTPNSPGSASVLRISSEGEQVAVSPGGYNDVGAPQFNNDGMFLLSDLNWTNFLPVEFGDYRDVSDIIIDPDDQNHLFVSVYGTGILELQREGEQLTILRLINEANTNGAIPSIGGDGAHRIADMDLDAEGNIWFGNSSTEAPLGVIRPDGSVESFSLGAAGSGAVIFRVMATSGGQVWLQNRNAGILVANVDDPGNFQVVSLGTAEGNGNLPSETVLAFAEDQDGEIWIGTNEGLAVLFSPENIFEPNRSFDASIIVIDEDGDGNGERVLGSQSISDIEVDGSNKKWFATSNSGAFYTSANGREQILRFETGNSPLPSNNIIDIEVSALNGRVYFGTDEGIVTFQGQATEGVETMTDVFAYPNPVQPGYEGPILIRGLVTNAQVKITDMEGNIVFETVAEGGQAIWSGRRFDGQRVRSGVYLAYITDDLGANTEVTKILVVN